MKKLVTIFLLALYAMSVSASVVRIRYCGMMQTRVVIATIESNDCCCPGGSEGQMAMRPDGNQPDYLTAVTGLLADSYNYTAPSRHCCTEIVLQTRLAANQLVSSETNTTVLDQGSLLMPALVFNPLPVFDLPQQHQPLAIAFKAPPRTIPLYKLFHRFTYYG